MRGQQADSTECYFCGHDDRSVLETHHIVPRRFGGSDDQENLVTVCPNCHQKLEELYGPRFYDQLSVYRRKGKTPDGKRIPDTSAHFWVSYDEEGYRQFTCRLCSESEADPSSKSDGTDNEISVADTVGPQPAPAFFDQDEAISHLDEEHDISQWRNAKQPPESQCPMKADRPQGPVQR